MPTIIDPKTETAPRIAIPTLSEVYEPKNAPPNSEVERWHDMAHEQTTVYKQKDADPKTFNAKCFFKPTAVIPYHDTVKNLVEYKFNVSVLTHRQKKDEGGNWVMHNVTEENGAVRPNFIMVPCKDFLEMFAPVVQ